MCNAHLLVPYSLCHVGSVQVIQRGRHDPVCVAGVTLGGGGGGQKHGNKKGRGLGSVQREVPFSSLLGSTNCFTSNLPTRFFCGAPG